MPVCNVKRWDTCVLMAVVLLAISLMPSAGSADVQDATPVLPYTLTVLTDRLPQDIKQLVPWVRESGVDGLELGRIWNREVYEWAIPGDVDKLKKLIDGYWGKDR